MVASEEPTIAQIRYALLNGDVSAAELTESFLARIDALDDRGPTLHAINTVNPSVLSDAEALTAPFVADRPLLGVAVVVKDHIDVAGLRTTYGSAAFTAHTPTTDAPVVARLRRAGALILGKAAMADFGMSLFSTSSVSGHTRNPYDLDRDAGGSSGGSAASVAAGMCAVAVGGDTGGSVRVPASFCGLVGLRPSVGSVPLKGTSPLVSVQDTLGPLARTVADAEALWRVMSGRRPRVAHQAEARPRVGVLSELLGLAHGESHPGVAAVVEDALVDVSAAGVEVVPELRLSNIQERLRQTSLYLVSSKAELDSFLGSLGVPGATSLRSIQEAGLAHPSLDLFRDVVASPPAPDSGRRAISEAQLRLAADVIGLMDAHRVDALCFPTSRALPPLVSDLEAGTVATLQFPSNTFLASQCRFPALTVPVGFVDGLPVGLELVGRPGSEDLLFDLGRAVEQVSVRRPQPGRALS